MSDSDDGPTAIADRVNGFGELYPRHVGGAMYRVLSTRNDDITAHEVNYEDLTCSCQDQTWNKTEPEVCDHLAVVLFEAPTHLTIEDQAVDVILESVRQLRDGQQAGPVVHPASEAMETDGPAETGDSAEDAAPSDDAQARVEGAVGAVEAWLVDLDVPHGDIEVMVGDHDGRDGVRVDWMKPDLGEKDHEYLKSKINDVDGTTYHAGWMDDGCQRCGQADGEGFYHFPVSVAEGL